MSEKKTLTLTEENFEREVFADSLDHRVRRVTGVDLWSTEGKEKS